jgi:hypothetical protein
VQQESAARPVFRNGCQEVSRHSLAGLALDPFGGRGPTRTEGGQQKAEKGNRFGLGDPCACASRRNADLFVTTYADSQPSQSVPGFTIYSATGASRNAHRATQTVVCGILASLRCSEARGLDFAHKFGYDKGYRV